MGLDSKLMVTNLAFWGMEDKKITVAESPLPLMREHEDRGSYWGVLIMAAILGLCLGFAIMGQ